MPTRRGAVRGLETRPPAVRRSCRRVHHRRARPAQGWSLRQRGAGVLGSRCLAPGCPLQCRGIFIHGVQAVLALGADASSGDFLDTCLFCTSDRPAISRTAVVEPEIKRPPPKRRPRRPMGHPAEESTLALCGSTRPMSPGKVSKTVNSSAAQPPVLRWTT